MSIRDGYEAQPIIATGAPAEVPSVANTEHTRVDGELRVEHALNASQTLRGEYQRWDSRGDNLGVGEFELPERAYSDDTTGDIARLSAIGTIGPVAGGAGPEPAVVGGGVPRSDSSMSAPASSRAMAAAVWPCLTAKSSGVNPVFVRALISAPAAIRTWTTFS